MLSFQVQDTKILTSRTFLNWVLILPAIRKLISKVLGLTISAEQSKHLLNTYALEGNRHAATPLER